MAASPSLPRPPLSLQRCSKLAVADPMVVPPSPPKWRRQGPSHGRFNGGSPPLSSIPYPEQLRREEVSAPPSPPRVAVVPLPHVLKWQWPLYPTHRVVLRASSGQINDATWTDRSSGAPLPKRWIRLTALSPRTVHNGGSRSRARSGLTGELKNGLTVMGSRFFCFFNSLTEASKSNHLHSS